MNIVILAAGMGKRMHSALPKVLQPLAGRPLLAHVLDTARQLQPTRLCVVYGHGGDAVMQATPGDDITWIPQATQLGTGHAVLQALPHLDAAHPTLILYGDVPLTRLATLQNLLAQYHQDTPDETHRAPPFPARMALLTVTLDDPNGYGRVVRDAQQCIQAIVEQQDATAAQVKIHEVNTGIMVLPTPFLAEGLATLTPHNAQGEYYLTDLVECAVDIGLRIVSAAPDAVWETLGVNTRAQMAALERIYQHNLATHLLEQGVALADPARLDIRGSLRCGRDVFIDINGVFEGDVVLHDGVQIGAHCVIKNAVLEAGVQIAPFTHIEQTHIGTMSKIGPFARLRPGTRLAQHVHIGNFVEVKNSSIGAYSKANHLAYLGDAALGREVNIGAGVITCNYDGANKFPTVIEDRAFIGSDSQLVAPVRVGQDATIGAGTTLTKDAPAGKLTVSRSKQVTLEGWQRPVKRAQKKEE